MIIICIQRTPLCQQDCTLGSVSWHASASHFMYLCVGILG